MDDGVSTNIEPERQLTMLDCYAGIGSFSCAAKLIGGIATTQLIEIGEFQQSVLRSRFPGIPLHDDIRTFNPSGQQWDLFCAGVPCPPFSREGRRGASTDERNLFPDTLRLIKQVKPKWVVIENPIGLLTTPYAPGHERGSFFRHLLRSLSICGYVGEWLVLSAACFGLPHSRQRVFVAAYPDSTKFTHQPTPWAEQIRSEIEAARTNSPWRNSQSRISGNDAGISQGLDGSCFNGGKICTALPYGCPTSTPGRSSITRRRREVLGNTIALPVAIAVLRRVLYLNQLTE